MMSQWTQIMINDVYDNTSHS